MAIAHVQALDLISDVWANAIIDAINANTTAVAAASQTHADGPQGFLGVGTQTSPQSNITTEADVTGLSATVAPPANRRLRIEVKLSFYVQTAGAIDVILKNGAAQLQKWTQTLPVGFGIASFIWYGYSLGGSVTYRITAASQLAPGINTTSGATVPSIILVEDIGKV